LIIASSFSAVLKNQASLGVMTCSKRCYTSKKPGFLDPVWYGMVWYIWYHALVWYFTINRSRNIIKHFYDFDVIFFDSTRKPGSSRSEDVLKALVKRAAKARTDHQTLSVPEAMRVATFMLEQSTDHTLQMRVPRASAPPP
jgi:hypothetical protein